MKKLLLLLGVLLVILSGCEEEEVVEDRFFNSQFSSVRLDDVLEKYVVSIGYVETERTNNTVTYNIGAETNSEFDKLSPKKQYAILKRMNKIIKEASEYAAPDGDVACYVGYECNIQELIMKTPAHKYYTYYDSTVLYRDDETAYDPEDEKEKKQEVTVYESKPDVEIDSGYEWEYYSHDDKVYAIDEILGYLKASGKFDVDMDTEWYIGALDAFYKDNEEQYEMTIKDVISMVGVVGGKIIDIEEAS